jgi:hypothetical protein
MKDAIKSLFVEIESVRAELWRSPWLGPRLFQQTFRQQSSIGLQSLAGIQPLLPIRRPYQESG